MRSPPKLTDHFGPVRPLNQITPAVVDDFVTGLRKAYAPAYVARLIKYGKQFFHAARRAELTTRNPFDGVKAGSIAKPTTHQTTQTGREGTGGGGRNDEPRKCRGFSPPSLRGTSGHDAQVRPTGVELLNLFPTDSPAAVSDDAPNDALSGGPVSPAVSLLLKLVAALTPDERAVLARLLLPGAGQEGL